MTLDVLSKSSRGVKNFARAGGSAIFLHCFGPQKPWTGGCVAVPKDVMPRIMRSVRADCVVVIDTFEGLGASW